MARRQSRLGCEQAAQLLASFVAGLPARIAAERVGVHRHTARSHFHRLRTVIARELERASAQAGGREGVRFDLASFPVEHPRRRAFEPLFGLVVANHGVRVVRLLAVEEAADEPPPDAIVGLESQAQGRRRLRIVQTNPALGVECRRRLRAFWRSSVRHLSRFNGVPRQNLYLYLKECEWRFGASTGMALSTTLARWASVEY